MTENSSKISASKLNVIKTDLLADFYPFVTNWMSNEYETFYICCMFLISIITKSSMTIASMPKSFSWFKRTISWSAQLGFPPEMFNFPKSLILICELDSYEISWVPSEEISVIKLTLSIVYTFERILIGS